MADILDTYTFDTELIDLSDKGLTKLPDLTRFTKLKTLNCSYNQLIELNNLPNTLTYLDCWNNQLTELSNLPNTLTTLQCGNNQLTELREIMILVDFFCPEKFSWIERIQYQDRTLQSDSNVIL